MIKIIGKVSCSQDTTRNYKLKCESEILRFFDQEVERVLKVFVPGLFVKTNLVDFVKIQVFVVLEFQDWLLDLVNKI